MVLGGCFLRGWFRVSKVNELAARRYSDLRPDGIVELVSRNLKAGGLPSRFGGGIALTDGDDSSPGHQTFPRPQANYPGA